jgi:hypothetical protein
LRRHYLGRAVVVGGVVLTITAAAPVERWKEMEPLLRAIVSSYRATGRY